MILINQVPVLYSLVGNLRFRLPLSVEQLMSAIQLDLWAIPGSACVLKGRRGVPSDWDDSQNFSDAWIAILSGGILAV